MDYDDYGDFYRAISTAVNFPLQEERLKNYVANDDFVVIFFSRCFIDVAPTSRFVNVASRFNRKKYS